MHTVALSSGSWNHREEAALPRKPSKAETVTGVAWFVLSPPIFHQYLPKINPSLQPTNWHLEILKWHMTGKTQRDPVEREGGGGSGWGTHVNPWLTHVNVRQHPLQYCKVISLQIIIKKIKEKKNFKVAHVRCLVVQRRLGEWILMRAAKEMWE